MEKIVVPFIVRYAGTLPQRLKKDITNVLEGLDKKYRDLDAEYENIFEGPEFP